MSVQHNAIQSSECHEPKNFSGAATTDAGKVNTPSGTTAGVSVLRLLLASEVSYDGTDSGLSATDVKDAIDELTSEKADASGGAIVSPVLDGPSINDTSDDHQYVFGVSELTADRTITLPLLTADDTFVFEAFVQTLTNKRVTPRISVVAYTAAIDVNSDSFDILQCDSLTGNVTVNAPTGTPTDGQRLVVRLTQDATGSRTVTFNAAFVGATAETGTASTTSTWEFLWNVARSSWIQVAATVDV